MRTDHSLELALIGFYDCVAHNATFDIYHGRTGVTSFSNLGVGTPYQYCPPVLLRFKISSVRLQALWPQFSRIKLHTTVDGAPILTQLLKMFTALSAHTERSFCALWYLKDWFNVCCLDMKPLVPAFGLHTRPPLFSQSTTIRRTLALQRNEKLFQVCTTVKIYASDRTEIE